MTYTDQVASYSALCTDNGTSWGAIDPDAVARMQLQNRFRTGLDIARYTADIMRRDMADYDLDVTRYTQSLGCWHGFIGQQKMISVKSTTGPPTNVTSTFPVGWSPRCVPSSGRFPTSRCTRRLRYQCLSKSCTRS